MTDETGMGPQVRKADQAGASLQRAVPVPVSNGNPDPIQLGKVLAASGYFADARDAAKAAVKVMAGAELGFGPIASMIGVSIIEGKPSIGGAMLAGLVKSSERYDYRIEELSDERCSVRFYEAGKPLDPPSVFTLQDAKRADLAGKKNWRQYPRNMLFWRAISNGVAFHCPDLTAGVRLYTYEELGADVEGRSGEIITPPPTEPAAVAEGESKSATKTQIRQLVKRARDLGIEAGRLRLAAAHVAGRDLGEFHTQREAVEAFSALDLGEVEALAEWVSEQADQAADDG